MASQIGWVTAVLDSVVRVSRSIGRKHSSNLVQSGKGHVETRWKLLEMESWCVTDLGRTLLSSRTGLQTPVVSVESVRQGAAYQLVHLTGASHLVAKDLPQAGFSHSLLQPRLFLLLETPSLHPHPHPHPQEARCRSVSCVADYLPEAG